MMIMFVFLYQCLLYPVYRLSCLAKRKNIYLHFGRLLAVSLCNGGSVGRCLAPCIFDVIISAESACQPEVSDVQQPEVRTLLDQVSTIRHIYRGSKPDLQVPDM